MPYHDLYKFCQTLEPAVSRKVLRKEVLGLTNTEKIREGRTTLDTKKCRGFFLSANNSEHPLVKQYGSNVIVLAREMNNCWDRFVYVKELMHLFDDIEEATDTGEEFEGLLTELLLNTMERSPQLMSEIKCFWMALAAMCPEKYRTEYKQKREDGFLDDYGIALKLKIPTEYVPLLFTDIYDHNLEHILQEECD